MHDVESMFSVREVPWHGLGRIVSEAPDSEQALVLGGLNWAVNQQPVYVKPGRNYEEVPAYFANTRATDGKVLGIVGERYRILQNREAFAWTDALMGEGVRYETAGSLGGGKEVWLTAKVPEVFRILGDEVQTYILLTNSHDGSRAVRAAVTPIRTVCRNTLNLALRKAKRMWATKHTGDMSSKVQEARRALGLVRDYMQELNSLAEVLHAMQVRPDDWSAMVKKLMPVEEGELKSAGVIERNKARQKALYDRMLVPDLEPHRWTAWGAVNAVADFVDHAKQIRPTATSEERRFRKVMWGHEMLDETLKLVGAPTAALVGSL